jgi:hypothetical protein
LHRRRAVGLGAVLAFGACAIAASSAHACDAGRHVQAAHAGQSTGRAPLALGDSTMIFAAPVLGRLGVEADARGCRGFAAGVDLLASRRRGGTLPRVVVLALGANGSTNRRLIGRALRAVGRRRILALVTPRNQRGGAAAMRRAARRFPDRVLLIDWVRYSARHEGWFGEDDLHVGQPGANGFARLIRRAIAPFAFPPARSLRMPVRAARTHSCGTVRRSWRRLRVYVTRGTPRITCRRARQLARRPALRRVANWRVYDWRGVRRSPWDWVISRADRRVVIGAVER